MDPLLFKAAKDEDFQALLRLLQDDPLILERVPTSGDTPLHVAAMLGHLEFVKELIKHKSNVTEYVKEQNQDGFSPLHMASANGHVEVVRELLRFSNELCILKGRENLTPLHCASIKGRSETIIHLLSVSPSCVSEETATRETALHLAVKNNQLEALRTLVEGLKLNNMLEILNSKDEEGNTALHLAAGRKNRQVIELLLNCNNETPGVLQVNATNKSGLTALDIFLLCPCEFGHAEIERLLRRVGAARARDTSDITHSPPSQPNLSTPTGNVAPSSIPRPDGLHLREGESWEEFFKFQYGRDNPSEVRNALLVVAVLMATATYQAVLSPPGGVHQEGDNEGQALLASYDLPFILFIFFNSAGFFVSLYTIMLLTSSFPLWGELYVAIVAMAVTYDTALVQASLNRKQKILSILFAALIPPGIPCISKLIREYYKRRRGGLTYKRFVNA